MKKLTIPFLLGLLTMALLPSLSRGQNYITTIAGVGLGDDSLATKAELLGPVGIGIDNAGNTYISDESGYRVRKVSPSGIITTFAGSGTFGSTGDGGPATAAKIGVVYGICSDKTGNIYLVDAANNCIRKVNTAGIISTIGGIVGPGGYSGDGGPATAAEFNAPIDIVADTSGNLYITDFQNAVVRKIDAAGIVTTVVGDGSTGTFGDGGPATASELGYPFRVAMDRNNNLFVAEVNGNYICKVDTAGIIRIVGGTGVYMLGPDGDGGPATNATMAAPCGLAVDTSGNLYFSDIDNNRIRKIDLNTGIISAFAATGVAGYSGDGGPATAGQISTPEDLVCDAAGNLYICDASNNLVRKVSATGTLTSFAGQSGLFDEGIPALNAELTIPANVATDAAGNIYVPDMLNNRVRKIDAITHNISTVAGLGYSGYDDAFTGDGGPATAAHIFAPAAVAIDHTGNMYIADLNNNRIRKVSATGIITTVGGNGSTTYNGDNIPATAAALYNPSGVAVDNAGNILVADQGNSRIRKIDTAGMITTVAGSATAGYAGDGGQASFARLKYPTDVATDAQGNFYISDSYNQRVRKVDTAGIISTIAGTGTSGSSGDGGPAINAQLSYPSGLKADNDGNVYIADGANHKIRMINTAGIINTVAGTGTAGFSGDNNNPLYAKLNTPSGVAPGNSSGEFYIADGSNYRIRKVMSRESVDRVANNLEAATAYPNPAHDKLTVDIPTGVTPGMQLSLLDILGNKVLQLPIISSHQTLSMQHLASGIYILQLKNATGSVKNIKVVKE